MRALVLGSGGREHALVWSLNRGGAEVLCAPGNGGIAADVRCLVVSPMDSAAVLEAVRQERVDVVVIGPEVPLAEGVADRLREGGVPVVGPSRAAARLESSKVFAKQFMARHDIPTAAFSVHSDAETAMTRIESSEVEYPIVIKADGLAAGKGVIVARSRDEARIAVHRILVAREFGEAGAQLVVEDFLRGREASFIVFTDGETIVPAVPARDHKAVYDDDRGPNTGGMGAFSSDNILAAAQQQEILEGVVQPVIEGMRSEGSPFSGMLYVGLMLTPGGPKVLEFNVRMGDPEAQVILPRLSSSSAALFEALASARLGMCRVEWTPDPAVCIVLASGGYPGKYETGKVISGLEMAVEDPRVVVFHAGTQALEGRLVTSGGRVLGVTAVSSDLQDAVVAAYEAVNKIRFEGMHYRRDIGRTGMVTS